MARQRKRKRRRQTFTRDRPLPEDFARDYVIALRALSRKHKNDPETHKAEKLLKRMSREASLAGRGEVWMPLPGPTTGHYPVIEDLPFSKVRTALRKNTLKRKKAWEGVAAATRPFYPQHGAVSRVEKSLLPAVLVALPFVRGRTPALLGKRVPGELRMAKRSGSSIIPIQGISPDEWAQHGFQPLKFMHYGLRERLKTRMAANRKKADKQMRTAWGWERRAIGKEDLTPAQAQAKAKKLSAPGTKIVVAKGARPWFRAVKGKREINVPPHSAAIAHEATHTRQHAKLKKGFAGLYKGAAAAGVATGATLAMLRGSKMGRFKKLSRWAAPAAVAAGQVPKLALEGGAIKGSSKEKNWKKGAKLTVGSYLTTSAATTAGTAGIGHLAGKRIRAETLSSTLARRALQSHKTLGWKMLAGKLRKVRHLAGRRRFAFECGEILTYEKGYQYGLRSFLRRHHVSDRLKRGALPAALGGLVLEGLRRAHTEFGIPPTTVDLVPVQRTSIKGEYSQFSSMQLGQFIEALANRISDADEATTSEIQKQIGKLRVEIIGRRAI